MIANQIDVLDNDSGFAEAVTTYLKAVDAGQSPDPQEWLQRYPELAEELADFFAGQEQLDRLSAPLRALAPAPELPSDMRSRRAIADGGALAHADSANSWPSSENRIFGDYQLLEVIARGGMGIVYKARHGRLNRIVALKLILSGQFAKRSDVERFQTEAEAAASLDYPHIVPIYEVGEERGQHYFSMKLIEGQNLAQRLAVDSGRDGKTLAEPRTLLRPTTNSETRKLVKILATVADAVHYAHQHGILHRDLKPGNILLDSAEQPYVTDFGLAKLVEADQTATQSGAIIGTASYMAPEQAAGSKGLTTAADIYSLGAILYEVLTGRPPFREETALETLLHVREREPARPSDVHPKVDRDLETICIKCLERDPLRRYGSAEVLAEELDRWLAGEPIHARPVSRVERTWRHCRRNPVVSSLLAAVVLVAAGGFIGVITQWQVAVANAAAAQLSAQEAKNQAQEVKALADRLQRTLYAAHMNLAKSEWDVGAIVRMEELLEQHRPKQGEIDVRGFEWHYLHRLRHSNVLTLNGNRRNVGEIGGVAYSPDGKRVAFGSSAWNETTKAFGTREVKVCDAKSGQELVTCKGHTEKIHSVVFSPDGQRLASAAGDNTVRVWDAQSGQQLHAFTGHNNGVANVAFSPDGNRLASAAEDKTIKVWDVQTGRALSTLAEQTEAVSSVALSPDGKRLASASRDSFVKVWDAQTGEQVLSFKVHPGDVESVTFSPDGKSLASAGSGGVKLWNAQSGEESGTFKGHTDRVYSVAFSSDGKRLTGGAWDKTVKVWDAETGQELLVFKGHSLHVSNVTFNPDGTRLASCSYDGTIKIWDATASQEARSFSGTARQITSVVFSPDGTRLAFGSHRDAAKNDDVTADVRVRVWDAQTGQELLSCKGHTGFIHRLAFSPDGKRLASASTDKTVRIWNATTGREILTFRGHSGPVASLAFSPDSTRLASSSSEVMVWEAETGQAVLTLKGHSRYVDSVAFSPDGKRLATLSRDNTVKVWNAQDGTEIFSLKARSNTEGSVAFSPDGKLLASSNSLPILSEVKVWDAQTGEERLTLKGHTSQQISTVVFSPDSKRLASSNRWDRTVKIWDTTTGQEMLSLTLKGGVNSVAFSPDGHYLATNGPNSTVKIYDATPLPEKP